MLDPKTIRNVAIIAHDGAGKTALTEALLRHDAPSRAGKDGPCFLYAAGNQVVLSQRRTQPITPLVPKRRSIAAVRVFNTSRRGAPCATNSNMRRSTSITADRPMSQ